MEKSIYEYIYLSSILIETNKNFCDKNEILINMNKILFQTNKKYLSLKMI